MSTAQTSDAGAAQSEILILDDDTRSDLRLFGATSDANGLFNFCNRCRTPGGSRALRRRMESPWSDAARIRATQDAVSFVIAHRALFDALPSEYVAVNVERYCGASMPVVRQDNAIEFIVGALSIRTSEGHFYSKITQGVELTVRVAQALRRFVREAARQPIAGELKPLLDEMRALLDRPRLARIPDEQPGRWFWTRLRMDQAFRLHEKAAVARLLELVYELDALVAMADVTREHSFVLPAIEAGAVRVCASELTHPLLTDAVGNPLELDQTRRVVFLTGPNMAGKTTYLRAVASALYLAHLGMGVPARTFRFVPVQCLLTSISLADNLDDGVSYFRAEALRMKAVAQAVADGLRVIAIMDEPFKGTNIKDAFDASLAILERLAGVDDCLFMVASHLIELKEPLSAASNVDYLYFEAQEHDDRLRFDYLLHDGVSSQRLGMRVLREEGVFDLLDGMQDAEYPEYPE